MKILLRGSFFYQIILDIYSLFVQKILFLLEILETFSLGIRAGIIVDANRGNKN